MPQKLVDVPTRPYARVRLVFMKPLRIPEDASLLVLLEVRENYCTYFVHHLPVRHMRGYARGSSLVY